MRSWFSAKHYLPVNVIFLVTDILHIGDRSKLPYPNSLEKAAIKSLSGYYNTFLESIFADRAEQTLKGKQTLQSLSHSMSFPVQHYLKSVTFSNTGGTSYLLES